MTRVSLICYWLRWYHFECEVQPG